MSDRSGTESRKQSSTNSLLLFVSATLIYGIVPVLTTMSKTPEGSYPYNQIGVVMLVEVVKFASSFLGAYRQASSSGASLLSWRPNLTELAWVATPTLLYVAQNNLTFRALFYMDPATFQVLSNLKNVSTALLWRFLLKRNLRSYQWMAVLFMLLGSFSFSLSNSGGCDGDGVGSGSGSAVLRSGTGIVGFVIMLIIAALSGGGSVSTEYAYQREGASGLHFLNMQMYGLGVVFNLLLFLLDSSPIGLLEGITPVTWMIIAARSLGGLLISLVFKRASSIIRLFIIVGSAPLALFFSWLFLGQALPTLEFIVSSTTVLASVCLYNLYNFASDVQAPPPKN
eukprot:PLAT4374.1.p1 GENE.PLAT4374.1~~PLAT4374.1.p1  ORF type:complete len:340 (+),score=170.10 PLAT4374.1:1-1020(+)